jgi:hypothetical protein
MSTGKMLRGDFTVYDRNYDVNFGGRVNLKYAVKRGINASTQSSL